MYGQAYIAYQALDSDVTSYCPAGVIQDDDGTFFIELHDDMHDLKTEHDVDCAIMDLRGIEQDLTFCNWAALLAPRGRFLLRLVYRVGQ